MTKTKTNLKQTAPDSSSNIPSLPMTNSDLKSLHDSLIETVSHLNDAIGSAPDEKTIDALTTEMMEVNHRVAIVGNLLFTQNSQEISDAIKPLDAITTKVNNSIQQAQSAITVINSVTSYLELVDNVIDTAKEIAAT